MARFPEADKLIRAAIVETFPDRDGTVHRQFLEGIAHSVARVTFEQHRPVIVKLCQEPRLEDRFRKEADILPYIGVHTGLPVPTIKAADLTGDRIGRPFMVLTDMAGSPPPEPLTAADTGWVREYARMIAQLHAHRSFSAAGRPVVTDGDLTNQDSDPWQTVLQRRISRVLQGVARSRFADLGPELEIRFATLLDAIEETKEHVILKDDVSGANVLIDNDTVSAVLDWEGTLIGPPSYDLYRLEEAFAQQSRNSKDLRSAIHNGYSAVRELPTISEPERELYELKRLASKCWGFQWRTRDDDSEQIEQDAQELRQKITASTG